MARVTTKETTAADQAWEEYFAIQLTPEQKAAGRAELEKRVEEAAAAGVYDRVMELVGRCISISTLMSCARIEIDRGRRELALEHAG